MAEAIRGFQSKYRWLSNFWPAEVGYGKWVYPTAEHAYQAQKVLHEADRRAIQYARTPGVAKRLVKTMPQVAWPLWAKRRLDVMYTVVSDKFHRHADLAKKLLDTGDAFIEETNTWGDTWWGTCNGEGHNHLGRILMLVREELRRESELAEEK